MDLFFNAIKGQLNSLNLILFTALLSYLFYKMNRRRTGRVLAIFAFSFFLLFSTNYLPGYLIKRLESKFVAFDSVRFQRTNGDLYIHVLGAGYTDVDKLPEHAQLSHVGLGRLSEGIRILQLYKNSTLVVSGNIASGDESLATVARAAAITLGIDPARVEMLEDPSTTHEEAEAFAKRFGTENDVIVVTDAVHMPRALQFFKEQGLDVYPAPTNFMIKEDDNPFALKWVPAAENFLLMDRIWREFFGSIKGWLLS